MMMEVEERGGGGRGKKKKDEFAELIFSWSLNDILNQDLYKTQVDKIPLTFDSEQQYFSSFVYPLLEETRAELACSIEIIHRYPSAHILSIHEASRDGKAVYDVKVGPWRNRNFERGKPPYQTLPGDLLIFMDGKAESVSDLQRMGRTWAFSLVSKITENDDEDDLEATPSRFTVKASKPLKFQDGMFLVFLKNIKIQTRIWDSLHMNGNLNIIKAVLDPHSMVKENCDTCSFDLDLGVYDQDCVKIKCDSKAAMQIAANPVFHEKTKHFEIDLFFTREKVLQGIIEIIKIASEHNVADVFTKGLPQIQHQSLCDQLGLFDPFHN